MKTITYKFTNNYDPSAPDNNFMSERFTICGCDDDYTLADYLDDNGVDFEVENGTLFVLYGERTGEAYEEI